MEDDIESALNELIKTESKKISYVVIEGKSNIVDFTVDWEVTQDIQKIIKFWNEIEKEEKFIEDRIKNLEEELQDLKGDEIVDTKDISDEIINIYKVLKRFYNQKIAHPSRIIVSKETFIVLQWNTNRLIAVPVDKKGGLVGFKDEERRIIYKIDDDGSLPLGLMEASRELWERSLKGPYMEADESLGRVEQLEWATPRILLDDTNNLQELGLIKFGLSIEEAKVYWALLRKGKEGEKVGVLNSSLDIKRTTIYRIIDRLIDKEWVEKLHTISRGAQIYVARPINEILDERIQKQEKELKILKTLRFMLGETLENGWINIFRDVNELKEYEEKALDYKTLRITGAEKDCGVLIFEYNKAVDNDIIIRSALQLACEKLKINLLVDEDIEEFLNPDLEDVKFVDTEIQDYLGATMQVKFKEGSETANNIGSDWIVAAKQVAIPYEKKIFIMWSSEEKFSALISIFDQITSK